MIGSDSFLATLVLLVVGLLSSIEVEALFGCARDDALQRSPSEVIPVPPSSWLSIRRFVNESEGNSSFVLRSEDPNCFVEAKFRQYAGPYTTQLVVYPSGRSEVRALDDAPPSFCYWGTNDVIQLGLSAVSTGPELGILLWSFDPTEPLLASFELVYRQVCHPNNNAEARAFELQAPPSNGKSLTFTYQSTVITTPWDNTWKQATFLIPRSPSLGCSLEVKFDLIEGGEVILSFNPFFNPTIGQGYVGLTYVVPVKTPLYIRSNGNSILKMDMSYRAVCGPKAYHGTDLRRPALVPIEVSSLTEWTTVKLDKKHVPAASLFIWVFQQKEPSTTQVIIEQDALNSTTNDVVVDPQWYYPYFPSEWSDIFGYFQSQHTIYSLLVTRFTERLQVTFRYKLVSTVPLELSINDTSDSWQNFTIPAEELATTSNWRLKSARPDCRFEAGLAIFSPDYVGPNLLIEAFEFSPDLTETFDYTAYPGGPTDVRFYGEEIALSYNTGGGVLLTSPLHGAIQWPYRLACANMTLSPPLNGTWSSGELVPPGSYLLSVPPLPGCSIDVFTYRYVRRFRIPETVRVVCADAWTLLTENLEIQTRPLGGCNNLVLTPFGQGFTPFFYRLRCPGGPLVSPEEELPNINIGEVVFVDSNKWMRIPWNRKGPFYPNENNDDYAESSIAIKTFRAKRRGCFVEFSARNLNLATDMVTEDSLELNMTLEIPPESDDYDGILDRQIESLTYVSCTNTLYVQAFVQHGKRFSVRQICPSSSSPVSNLCGQLRHSVQATFEWQTIDLVAYNPFQLRRTIMQIVLPSDSNHSSGLAIELYFTSLVEQVVIGEVQPYRSPLMERTGLGRVRTNGFPAFLGKSRLFTTNVTITADFLAKKGDHIFTAKFRLRNLTDGGVPSRGIDTLVATNQTKSIKFKIPKQFSEAKFKHILTQDVVKFDDYGELFPAGGRYYRWMFRHVWAIKPETVGCRVLAKVTKLDIGAGNGVFAATFKMFQHRLAIGPGDPDRYTPAFNGALCETLHQDGWPSIEQPWTVIIGNLSQPSICGRVGPYYLSDPAPGNSLIVRFETVARERMEYEFTLNEREETWGSGWELEYSQVCDPTEARQAFNRPLIPVLATAKWQTLPPLAKDSAKLEWFTDLRYHIVPSNRKCFVRVSWRALNERDDRILRLFDAQSNPAHFSSGVIEYESYPSEMMTANFQSASFSVILLSIIPSKKAGKFLFRQECESFATPSSSPVTPTTSIPSVTPSMSPTFTAPTRSPTQRFPLVNDGGTCYKNDQCESGICSKALASCLAKTCASRCKAQVTRPRCARFAEVGCACQWNSLRKRCLVLL